ncbi:hypothetical protein [Chamaesiphon minutus]|uniref:Uncharacterized protein n=1 Tax=Chamaesiphon minutus (strain ATCC 27169 / PCC 6605) TaxID=1173020 RepID=K9UM83_CHAP6|nr:hypothetical protein [Chamaesiphon minutus]AFY95561.1 hypothetical protein Cha6605_4643 [Chamaesiphon minutus PCC 6605]
MESTEPIELQLQKARSLFQQWQGFSARVLFYDGDPGMFAQFSIFLSEEAQKLKAKKYFAAWCSSNLYIGNLNTRTVK